MKVKCNECGHEGEAKTNSRGETRCEACYSVNVEAVAEVVPPVVKTPAPPEPEKQKQRKRMTG